MIAVLLAISLQFTSEHARLAYDTAGRLVADFTPRDAGSVSGHKAAEWLAGRAKDAGARVHRDVFTAASPLGTMRFVNVYGEFVFSPTNSWTVFLSHYDTKRAVACPGANDGASTSGLLVGLAKMLSGVGKLNRNVLLVWTDSEECIRGYSRHDGLQGSRRAVEYVKSRKLDVKEVFCLDMLGDRNLRIEIPANGSRHLARLALEAARRSGRKDLVSLSPFNVIDDHLPFHESGYEAIDLIDFSYGSAPGLNDYWHTEKDVMDNVSVGSLEKSGALAAAILRLADEGYASPE